MIDNWGWVMRAMLILLLGIALLLLIGVATGRAAEVITGPVEATVIRVYDGDTITVQARPWIGVALTVSVRVDGIDTPEIRGKCDEEKALAQQAKAWTQRLIADQPVKLWRIKRGKYAGRVVARVQTVNGDLATQLVAHDMARLYDGGARQPWC